MTALLRQKVARSAGPPRVSPLACIERLWSASSLCNHARNCRPGRLQVGLQHRTLRAILPLQVKRLALRPLPRSFGPLRKVEMEHPGAGYLVTCPPDLAASEVLPKSRWSKLRCQTLDANPRGEFALEMPAYDGDCPQRLRRCGTIEARTVWKFQTALTRISDVILAGNVCDVLVPWCRLWPS